MDQKLKPAIAYIRVSTKSQQEDGNGLELQRVRIQEFARHSGYEIVETFKDAHTGKDDRITSQNRPGAHAAGKLSRETGWPIIVDELSRFSRNTAVLERLIFEGKLTVIAATLGTRVSRAVRMGEAARAQRERELISQNTKQAMQRLKEQGIRLGNQKNLPEAQAKGAAQNRGKALARARDLAPVIRELRAGGRTTARDIAEGLNHQGHQTPRGEAWTAVTVRRLLERVDELEKAEMQRQQHETYDGNPLYGAF